MAPLMLVDLVPEFLAALAARDPVDAYRRYLDAHRPVLAAYWRNYVLDLDSPVHGRFDAEDARGLERLVRAFVASLG